jgi:hypothetical protein
MNNPSSRMKIQSGKKGLDFWEKSRGAWLDGAKPVF